MLIITKSHITMKFIMLATIDKIRLCNIGNVASRT